MGKKIIIYGIGTFCTKLIVFLMVPIYTRVFSTADYGYYDVIISDIQMIVSIAFVEIWSAIMRYMFSDEKREKSIKAFVIMLPMMIVFYAICIALLSRIIAIKYPFIIFMLGISYLLFNVGNTYCRGYGKNIDYVVSGMIYTIISCGLSLVWSVLYSKGIVYLFVAQIIGYLIAAIYVEIRTGAYGKALPIKVDLGYIIELLKYSIPLMANSFSFLFLGTYNKNVVLKKLGEEMSGQYAYILKYSAILTILISVYSLAWQEEAFIRNDDIDRDKIYSFYINNFFKVVGCAVPCYIVIAFFCAPVIGGMKYVEVSKYILCDVCSAYIAQISGLFSIIIAVNKKTWQTLISTLIGALVNVLMASLFIKMLGINGSSLSLCLGFIVSSCLRYMFVKTDMKFQINWLNILIFIIEIITLQMIIFLNNNYYIAGCGVIYCFIWVLLNKNEIEKFRKMLLRKIGIDK